MTRRLRAAALVLALLAAGGCGQKGPLYLPGEEDDEEQASRVPAERPLSAAMARITHAADAVRQAS